MRSSKLFAPVTAPDPLRVLVVGAGGMGMAWLRAVQRHANLALVGIVDVDERRAKGAAIRLGRPDLPVAATLAGLGGVDAEVCVNVTPPDAHAGVVAEALARGLSVLTEKPFATALSEAVRLTALARQADRLLMVSQSRAYEPGLLALRTVADRIGPVGLVHTEFGVAYRPTGFRAGMAHPLLLDMAVHAFDGVRRLTGAGPVSVYCDAFNPPWSRYSGDSTAVVIAELDGGIRYAYSGSWCADGLPTSWNGRWRLTAAGGTAEWDGHGAPRFGMPHQAEGKATQAPAVAEPVPAGAPDPVVEVARPLADFVTALRTGCPPWGECGDNLLTMAMVEAAIRSVRDRRPVAVADLLAEARAEVRSCGSR